MITQEQIEDIILEAIAKELQCLKNDEQAERMKILQERLELDEQWEKLDDFSNRHQNELQSIFPVGNSHTNFFGYGRHLGAVYYELSRDYNFLEFKENDLDNKYDKYGEYVNLSYQEISSETGLDQKSVKKYIDILERKGRLIRKKSIGGYLYKLEEE